VVIKHPSNRLEYIDALKGFAIIGVLLVHCQLFGQNSYHHFLREVINNGTMGVPLFFLLSSITLCLSSANSPPTSPRSYLAFFLRRFFRIAPLYYLALIVYLQILGPSSREMVNINYPITPLSIASSFMFLSGLNPYWANTIFPGQWIISVQMGFYLIFPFLFSRLNSLSKAVWLALFSAVISQLIYLIVYKRPPIPDAQLWKTFLYYTLPYQLPVFLIGFVLYFLIFSRRKWVINHFSRFLLAAAFLFILNLILTNILPYHFVFSCSLAVIIYALSAYSPNLLVNRFTTFLGRISYSLYLVHYAVLHYLSKLQLIDFTPSPVVSFFIRFSLLLIISSLVSFLTYRLIEQPGQKFGFLVINHLLNRPLFPQSSLSIVSPARSSSGRQRY
jgi:peptidoglycan/LPS O-acetylase OafA/YrhL